MSTKISAMTDGVTADATDKIPVARSSANRYITPAYIKTYINPMTTAGDIIKGGVSGVLSRLGIGTNGDVLTVVAGAPAWQAPAGGSSTGLVARAHNSSRVTLATLDVTRIDFDTVDYDPGSDVTTGAAWVYTCPATAWYRVCVSNGFVYGNGNAWANTKYMQTVVNLNGSSVGIAKHERTYAVDSSTSYIDMNGGLAISCTAGNTLSVDIFDFTNAVRKFETDGVIEVHRVT